MYTRKWLVVPIYTIPSGATPKGQLTEKERIEIFASMRPPPNPEEILLFLAKDTNSLVVLN